MRMKCFTDVKVSDCLPFEHSYMRMMPLDVSNKDGSISRACQFQKFDGVSNYDNCKVSDFSVRSLIATGNINYTSTVTVPMSDRLGAIDSFDSNMSQIVDYVQDQSQNS